MVVVSISLTGCFISCFFPLFVLQENKIMAKQNDNDIILGKRNLCSTIKNKLLYKKHINNH
jgi:hypothetical protein